jgi:hypothetical protein
MVEELDTMLQYAVFVQAEHEFAHGRKWVPDEQGLASEINNAMIGLAIGFEQPDCGVFHQLAAKMYAAASVRPAGDPQAGIEMVLASHIQAIGNMRADGAYLLPLFAAYPDLDQIAKRNDLELSKLPRDLQLCVSYILEDEGRFRHAAGIVNTVESKAGAKEMTAMRARAKALELLARLQVRYA